MSILNATIGEELIPLVKPPITQEQLQRYAEASGVIAQGMLSMAFLGQFINQRISDIPEVYLTRFKVRFSNMVRLEDTITCHGKIKARTTENEGYEFVTIECWAQNQKGEKVTVGEAVVSIPLTLKEEVKV